MEYWSPTNKSYLVISLVIIIFLSISLALNALNLLSSAMLLVGIMKVRSI